MVTFNESRDAPLYFRRARKDRTIDESVSHKELEAALVTLITNSNAWEQHIKMMHTNTGDARLVRLGPDEGISEPNLKSKKQEETQFFNYDSLTKHMVAGCQCGMRFDMDIKNNTVSGLDTGLKMRELQGYQKSEYANGNEQQGGNYNKGPAKSSNMGYTQNNFNKNTYNN